MKSMKLPRKTVHRKCLAGTRRSIVSRGNGTNANAHHAWQIGSNWKGNASWAYGPQRRVSAGETIEFAVWKTAFCNFGRFFRPGMSLTKQKEALIREKDRLTAVVDDLNKRLQQQRNQIDGLEKKRIDFEEKCRELYRLLDVSVIPIRYSSPQSSLSNRIFAGSVQWSVQRETISGPNKIGTGQCHHWKELCWRAIEAVQDTGEPTWNRIECKTNKCNSEFRLQCEQLQTNNVQLNLKIGAVKANLLRMTSQYNITNGKLIKAQNDLNEVTIKCDQLQIELTQQTSLVKQKEGEMIRWQKDSVQLKKCRDVTEKRAQVAEAEKAALAEKVTKLKWVWMQEYNKISRWQLGRLRAHAKLIELITRPQIALSNRESFSFLSL